VSEHNGATTQYQTDLSQTLAAVETAKKVRAAFGPGQLIAQMQAEVACMAFIMRHESALRAVGGAQ